MGTNGMKHHRKGAAVVAGMVLLVAACGGDSGTTIDAATLEEEISAGLEEAGFASAVTCPTDREAEAGDTFTCDAETETSGLEFDVDVVQDDDEGNVSFETPLLVSRARVEELLVGQMQEQTNIEEEFLADCSTDMDDEFVGEDGDTYVCGLGGIESGTGAAAEVTIDAESPDGFTSELIEGSGVEAEAEASGASGAGPEFITPILDERFDNDDNGWGPFEDEFVTTTISEGVFTWDFTAESGQDLYYYADVIAPLAGEIGASEFSADVAFTDPGRAGFSCMDDPEGDDLSSYYMFLDVQPELTGAYIGKYDTAGVGENLVSNPVDVDIDPTEPQSLFGRCVHDPDTGATSIEFIVDGETVAEVTDDDGLSDGIVQLAAGPDRTDGFVPMTLMWDNFVLFADEV